MRLTGGGRMSTPQATTVLDRPPSGAAADGLEPVLQSIHDAIEVLWNCSGNDPGDPNSCLNLENQKP